MFGVHELEKSYHELEKVILDIIQTYLLVPCDVNSVEVVRRTRRKGDKVRSVIITFSTMGQKLKIQKNKRFLLNTSYYIKENYPTEVLKKHKERLNWKRKKSLVTPPLSSITNLLY